MKKTLNVNIGQMAFVVDEDAYAILKRYLDDVESRFATEVRAEAMNDVEMRIADLFSEELRSARQVVTAEMVRRAMATLGAASEFGEKKTGGSYAPPPPRADLKQLRRSRTDRVIGGVCGGMAQYFNIDPILVRIIALLLILAGGLAFWAYIIAWIVIPEQEA